MNTVVRDTNLEQALAEIGTIIYKGKGFSMEPLIHAGRDLIVLERADRPLNKHEVALYRSGRPDKDGKKSQYVLHRVIAIEEERYIFLGDNCITLEYVPKDAVVAVMTGLIRDGREMKTEGFKNDLYLNLWIRPWRMRVGLIKARGKTRRAAAKAAKMILPDPLVSRIKAKRRKRS